MTVSVLSSTVTMAFTTQVTTGSQRASDLRAALAASKTTSATIQQQALSAITDLVSPDTLKKLNEQRALASSLITRSQAQAQKSAKDDAQQKLAQAQQKLRVLRLEVQQALASGDSKQAAILAQEAASVAKDLASAAKEYAAAGGTAASAATGESDAATALVQSSTSVAANSSGGSSNTAGAGGAGAAAAAGQSGLPSSTPGMSTAFSPQATGAGDATGGMGGGTGGAASSVGPGGSSGGGDSFLSTVRDTLSQLRALFDNLRRNTRKGANPADMLAVDRAARDFTTAEGQVADLANQVGSTPATSTGQATGTDVGTVALDTPSASAGDGAAATFDMTALTVSVRITV